MKILLVLIVCIQNATTSLEETCITLPTEQVFQSVPECMYFVNEYKKSVTDPNIYISGFCTTKSSSI